MAALGSRMLAMCSVGKTLKVWLDAIRAFALLHTSDAALKSATELSAGSTDTQVANTAFQYVVNGVSCYKGAVAAGTAFTATTHDIAQDKWSSYILSIDAAGTITITKAASDYDTEALAIAALASTPSNAVRMGYLTIKTASGQVWDATTDALAGGSSGNPASETNYYPDSVTVEAPAALDSYE